MWLDFIIVAIAKRINMPVEKLVYYHYLRQAKAKIASLGNMKRINLFQRRSLISLNNIENSNGIPLILPNLGKLGKIKEKNDKIFTKTFMKMQTIK